MPFILRTLIKMHLREILLYSRSHFQLLMLFSFLFQVKYKSKMSKNNKNSFWEFNVGESNLTFWIDESLLWSVNFAYECCAVLIFMTWIKCSEQNSEMKQHFINTRLFQLGQLLFVLCFSPMFFFSLIRLPKQTQWIRKSFIL